MKVSLVQSHTVYPGSGKHWVFVRVETADGLRGWGEVYTQGDRAHVVAAYVDLIGQYLDGRDPRQIRHFSYVMKTDLGVNHGSRDFHAALSGIEQALWDIVGKAANLPVHVLLGGRVRDRVRVYSNGWEVVRARDRDPDAIAERALEQVEAGYTALKFDPFPEPPRQYITRDDEQAALDVVARVREAVGPDVDLLIEAHRRFAVTAASRVARGLEAYDPFWFEEPVHPVNLEELAHVRSLTTIPIVAGESHFGHAGFSELLARRAVDFINPDVSNVGGIIDFMDVAAAAHAVLVGVAPHNYNSTTVATSASLHCAVAIPNFIIMEYFPKWTEVGQRVCPGAPVPEGGFLEAPLDAGLGPELDLDVLEELAPQEETSFRGKWIPRHDEEGPPA